MRIASGVTDQYCYFVAVDSTDLKTRKTGLTAFTVYRSRNGGTATAYTTPTITELSSSNMPGVYALLLDEDMTIDSGDVEQEVALHITCSTMAPVTRTYELFRPIVTAGETLTVSSGTGNAAVQSIASGAITATSIAADAITDAKVASDVTIASVTGSVGSVTGNVGGSVASVTGNVGGNVTGSVGSVATGGITAASIAADAIGASELAADAVAEIQSGLATSAALAVVAAYVDTEVAAIKAKTDNLPAAPAAVGDIPTANANADALLDRAAGVETNRTLRQTLRLMAAALLGKASGMATTTAVFRDTNDTKDRITATVDADGNRSAVTLDAS